MFHPCCAVKWNGRKWHTLFGSMVSLWCPQSLVHKKYSVFVEWINKEMIVYLSFGLSPMPIVTLTPSLYYNVIIFIFLSTEWVTNALKAGLHPVFPCLIYTLGRTWHVMETQENVRWAESSSPPDSFLTFPIVPICQMGNGGPEELRVPPT